MKSVSGKEFARILEKNGWELRRIKGSHHIFCKKGIDVRISVPVHGNKILKAGLLKHLLKLSELSEDELK